MRFFSATYPDFIKFDQKPNEDAFLVSEHYPIIAVADGVTQSHFPDGTYAYPQGAKEAADIFCKTSVEVLEKQFDSKNLPQNTMGQFHGIVPWFTGAFDIANQRIMELNKKWGIDKKLNYVEYDWFDTVGIVGMVVGDTLHYGLVGDCGLVVFDKDNKKKFQTPDLVRPAVEHFEKQYSDYQAMTPNQRALIMHRDFRNRPDGQGYGSFSGEEGVKTYYAFGSEKLESGDLAIFYTDGFVKHLEHPEFIDVARAEDKTILDQLVMSMAQADPDIYGHDRTLVAFVW